jgi:hypothetical protein
MILLVDDAKEGIAYDLVARNSLTAMVVLENLYKSITELYIDFDLGPYSELNGLQVLKFALDHNCLPNQVIIVSLNPGGREVIADFLKFDAKYRQVNNSVFVKETVE